MGVGSGAGRGKYAYTDKDRGGLTIDEGERGTWIPKGKKSPHEPQREEIHTRATEKKKRAKP